MRTFWAFDVAVATSRIADPLAGAANVADAPRSAIPITVIAAISMLRMSFLPFFDDGSLTHTIDLRDRFAEDGRRGRGAHHLSLPPRRLDLMGRDRAANLIREGSLPTYSP